MQGANILIIEVVVCYVSLRRVEIQVTPIKLIGTHQTFMYVRLAPLVG